MFAPERPDGLFTAEDQEPIGMSGEQRVVEQVKGGLRQVILTVLERQQHLAPSLLHLLRGKGWLQQRIEEQVQRVFDVGGSEK